MDLPVTEKLKSRRGWSLSLSLAIGLGLVLIAFALVATDPPFHFVNHVQETTAFVTALDVATQDYIADKGPFPKSLNNHGLYAALLGASPGKAYMNFKPKDVNTNGELIDHWGTPLRIWYVSDKEVGITSAGPDKIFGTADDITNQ
jgi:hypothetical protein